MHYIDLALRVASILVVIAVVMQHFREKGTQSHFITGRFAMVLGAILLVLVIIRGMNSESSGVIYMLHLGTGGFFFIFLFLTGFYGRKLRQLSSSERYYHPTHNACAYMTSIFLGATLFLGIISISI